MLIPGRIYVNTTIRIPVNYQNDQGEDIDPDTVTFKLSSPNGTITTFVYGTDAEVSKTSTGDYYIDVIPDLPGRWFFRWDSTGMNKATAVEGDFVVQTSAFYAACGRDDYR